MKSKNVNRKSLNVVIIDYNSGNIQSVRNALDKLNVSYKVSSNPEEIRNADKIIFPGVGRAKAAMEELNKRGLVEVIQNFKKPFLGICLGLQLLAEYSEEGNTKCLGIIPGNVKLFYTPTESTIGQSYLQNGGGTTSKKLKVPQIGWNKVNINKPSPITKGISNNEYFYFVNSYAMPINKYTIGQTEYGIPFSAIIQKDNFYATQFHPEKSGEIGQKILKNFIRNL